MPQLSFFDNPNVITPSRMLGAILDFVTRQARLNVNGKRVQMTTPFLSIAVRSRSLEASDLVIPRFSRNSRLSIFLDTNALCDKRTFSESC